MLEFAVVAIAIAILAFLFLDNARKRQEAEPLEPTLLVPDALGALTRPIAGMLPLSKKNKEVLRNELLGAGFYNSNAMINYLSRRNVGIMIMILVTLIVLVGKFFDRQHNQTIIISGFVATIFAYGLPRIILSSRASSRRQRIESAFPDALDMIALSVEGGLPLEDALKRVADEFQLTHRDLARELKIISRQTDTGSIQHAMSSFAERIDVPEIIGWSALITQSQRLGGQVAGSLIECADRMRSIRKVRAEKAGNTASIKLLLPTVLCLAPPIFILLIGPAVLDFRDFINREKENSAELVQQANESNTRILNSRRR